MSNFLKTLKRDLKKVNVERKQILKKRQFDIQNEKKKAQEMRKEKEMERFGETRKRKGQGESDTGDKKLS